MADTNSINTIEVFGRHLHEDSQITPETEIVSDLEQELRDIGIKNENV